MELDIYTLLAVLLLSYGANIVFSIVLYLGGNSFPGARLWILAQVLVALGTFLIMGRQLPYLLISIGNALVIGASFTYGFAVWKFRWGTNAPLWFYLVPLVFWFVHYSMQFDPVNSRTILYSFFLAMANLWVFFLLVWKIPKEYRYSAWMTGFPFLVFSVASIVQLSLTWLLDPVSDLYELGQGNALIFLLAILTASISLFGFYLLAGIRRRLDILGKERELSQANQELVKSNRTKDQFVSMLAHDLRAPISGVTRYIRKYLLAGDTDISTKRKDLEIVNQSLEKASQFLENVLWWSRAQKEDWVSDPIHFDISEIARAAEELLKPASQEKEIVIDSVLEPGWVWADYDSVLLIAQNLLSNAIKFSSGGTTIRLTTGTEDRGRTFLRIDDQGVGIPQDYQDRLYRIDTKLSTPGTKGELGSGMGLILCKDFAERNKADLFLESEAGVGTTVKLVFRET